MASHCTALGLSQRGVLEQLNGVAREPFAEDKEFGESIPGGEHRLLDLLGSERERLSDFGHLKAMNLAKQIDVSLTLRELFESANEGAPNSGILDDRQLHLVGRARRVSPTRDVVHCRVVGDAIKPRSNSVRLASSLDCLERFQECGLSNVLAGHRVVDQLTRIRREPT